MISFLNIYISLLALGREAASIQLQDALDRASSSETRARDAEERLVTEKARYHALEEQLNASQTRATDAESQARDARSQLDLQTQGTFFIHRLAHRIAPHQLTIDTCDDRAPAHHFSLIINSHSISTPINSNKQREPSSNIASLESSKHCTEQETRSSSNDSCLLLVDDPTSSKCLECSAKETLAWSLS